MAHFFSKKYVRLCKQSPGPAENNHLLRLHFICFPSCIFITYAAYVCGIRYSYGMPYGSAIQHKDTLRYNMETIRHIVYAIYGPYSMELCDFRHCILMLRKNWSYDLFGRIGSYHTLISSWIARHKASLSSYLEICNGNKDCSIEYDCVVSDPG